MSVVQARNVLSELATLAYVRNTRAHRNQYGFYTVNYPSLQAVKRGAASGATTAPSLATSTGVALSPAKQPYLDR